MSSPQPETRPSSDRLSDPPPAAIGRYQILGRLGAGGMGTVYKARDPMLDRVVALKMPHFVGTGEARERAGQRFQREARAAARIWHPHVCPIHDVGEHDGQPFVVMAFIDGPSLADLIAQKKAPDHPRRAVELARQVLDALAAVHSHGIVHRDLKPGNILIDPNGRAILTDFGLARPEHDQEHLTAAGVLVGTPAYMAPEQASGESERIGPRTDLYALGVVLYQLLTGHLPFQGPPLKVVAQILYEAPTPPSHWRPDLDPVLEGILVKALARNPEDRFASAAEFASDLKQWADRHDNLTTTPMGSLPERELDALPADEAMPTALVAEETDTLPEPRPPTTKQKRPMKPAPPRRRVWNGGLIAVLCIVLVCGSCFVIDWAAFVVGWVQDKMGWQTQGEKDSALLKAASNGEVKKLEEMIRKGADPNARDTWAETALMKAAKAGHAAVVEVLVRRQVSLNEKDRSGETALMMAAENGHAGIVQDLVRAGARIDEKDERGQTALTKAAARGHKDVVQVLDNEGQFRFK